MTYRVLARTWRPQRFADLLGQEAVVQTLSNALGSGTFGQAYLFSGLRGVGKTTAARLLAKAVNCIDGPTAEPCGDCQSCTEITDGSSIDVIEMDAATHTGVDDVRELQELLRYRPTRDRFRVIVVDEVHMLSNAAFNALLKTIEEPPEYILWVFATTERHKVPATILSRCQQLEFRPVGAELIRGRLEEIAATEGFVLAPSAAAAIAGAAEGSVRDALSLLDQLRAFADDQVDDEAVATVLGVPPMEVTADLVRVLGAGKAAEGLSLLRARLVAGQDASVLYREIGHALRTLLHLALDPELEPALTETHRNLLQPIAETLGADALGRMLGLWLEQEPLLREAGVRELALEVASLRLARWPSVERVESWLAGGGELAGPAAPSSNLSPAQAPPAEPGGAPPAGPAETPPSGASDRSAGSSLDSEARTDPQVVLATRVLGGEISVVRADGEGR
ncbi:MAG: DNA polymerase III subunit gamma/tau [Thermoanaerobaculales bacterium]